MSYLGNGGPLQLWIYVEKKFVCSILCNRNKIQKYMKFWSLRKTVTVVCVFSFGILVLISNDSLFLNVGSEFKQIDDIYTSMPLWIFNIVCIFALYVRFYLKTRLHCSKKNKTKNAGLAGRIWCLEVGGLGFKFKGCPVRHVPKLVFHNCLLDAVLSLRIRCLHAKS